MAELKQRVVSRLGAMTLGPFDPGTREVRFRFRCTHPGCSGKDIQSA
jgi:hypothetical protein